jgi:hypothetical protein
VETLPRSESSGKGEVEGGGGVILPPLSPPRTTSPLHRDTVPNGRGLRLVDAN